MKFITKSILLLLISALGSTIPLLAFKTGASSGMEMLPFVLFEMAIFLSLLTIASAILLIPTTAIECHLFKNKNIFKGCWHDYRMNISSLIATVLWYCMIFFVVIVVSLSPSIEPFIGGHIPIMGSLLFAIIFLLMRFRQINHISKNIGTKILLMLFGLINSAIFGSILYLYLSFRYRFQ